MKSLQIEIKKEKNLSFKLTKKKDLKKPKLRIENTADCGLIRRTYFFILIEPNNCFCLGEKLQDFLTFDKDIGTCLG